MHNNAKENQAQVVPRQALRHLKLHSLTQQKKERCARDF